MLARSIGRTLQRSNLGIARAIESAFLRGSDASPVEMPLVAICGAPRTGSTLTYQLATQICDFVFVSNAQNALFRTPLLASMLMRSRRRAYLSDYRSSGGYVRGLSGPAEAMQFWSYWLDHDLSEKTPQRDPRRRARFARVMNALYRQVQRPFLTGYLAHAFYIDDLRAVFPRVLMMRMDRDMLDAAYSALRRWRATRTRGRGIEFYGTRPRELLEPLDEHAYVARQQYFNARRLDAFERECPRCCFHARYSQVCSDPARFATELIEAMQHAGIEAVRRDGISLPDSFPESHYESEHDDDTREIKRQLDRLHEEFGPTGGVYRGTRASQPRA